MPDLVDAAGASHEPAENARIVSLVPSLTELLFDLGLGAQVAGRTEYCVHPADKLSGVPSLGGTKKIKMERLAEVGASHVLVNIDENPKELAEAIADTGVEVIVTHPNAPEDNPALYRLLGGLFGAQAAAADLCSRFDEALAGLRRQAVVLPARKVLYLIWKEPWMTVGPDTYIARMLNLVNWQTLVVESKDRYPEIDLTSAVAGSDLVLLSSEPFAFTEADAKVFSGRFPEIPVRLIDGEMTSWYGSRAIAGLAYLSDYSLLR